MRGGGVTSRDTLIIRFMHKGLRKVISFLLFDYLLILQFKNLLYRSNFLNSSRLIPALVLPQSHKVPFIFPFS